MFKKQTNAKNFVTVIADGMIGNPRILAGRLVPVLVIDCAQHPALEMLIQAHADTPPGDVVCSWGWNRLSKKRVYLKLNFKQPVETTATIIFQVLRQGVLVESILNARAVYLQPLTSGSSVSAVVQKPKIIVEIPASASFPVWEDVFRRALESRYRAEGLARTEAAVAAKSHISLIRDVQFRRMPQAAPGADI